MKHILKTGKLYILSGPSGSGKSTLLDKLVSEGEIDPSFVVSVDKIRKSILGQEAYIEKYVDQDGVEQEYSGHRLNALSINKEIILEMVANIIKLRCAQGLTTFFDDLNLTEKERNRIASIATKENVQTNIIFMNASRAFIQKNYLSKTLNSKMPLESQLLKFNKFGSLPKINFNPEIDTIRLLPNLIQTTKLDVVGDTHGLFSNLVSLMKKLGWEFNETKNLFEHPDKERKILFVGDAVDRGPDSFKILDILINMKDINKSYFVLGNHDYKLLRNIVDYKNGNLCAIRSIAGKITFNDWLNFDEQKRYKYYKFLQNTPTSYSLWIDKTTLKPTDKKDENTLSFGFAHANINSFDEYLSLRSKLLFGERADRDNLSVDNDKNYDKLYEAGINKSIYIHGHTPLKSKPNNVFSLDDNCAYNGKMIGLNLTNLINLIKDNNFKCKHEFFEKTSVIEEISFNFDNYYTNNLIPLDNVDTILNNNNLNLLNKEIKENKLKI